METKYCPTCDYLLLHGKLCPICNYSADCGHCLKVHGKPVIRKRELQMEKFRCSEVAELLGEYLRYRELRDVAPAGSTLYRRIYDIMNGKTQTVSLSVFDQLCLATGHLEWLQLIDPI